MTGGTRGPAPGRPISRRGFITISAVSALAVGLGGALTRRLMATGELRQVEETRLALGTYVRIVLGGPDAALSQRAIAATFARIEALESMLSRYRQDSALSQLNASGIVRRPPADLLEVLRAARRVSDWTGGAFDVTVQPAIAFVERSMARGGMPDREALQVALRLVGDAGVIADDDCIVLARDGMAITLDGIAKGFVVDAALAVIERAGYAETLVSASGDMRGGVRPRGSSWRIGVQDPRRRPGSTIAVARLTDRAIATSGDYLHAYTADFTRHHILDPRSGDSPPELSSVSVMAPTACLADGLSTGVMVMGRARGLELIERLPGVECLLVTKTHEVIASSGFPIVD